jgi:hypothetical protein
MKSFESVPCSIHPNEKLKYWCRDRQAAVCPNCLLVGYKEDKYVPIDKVAKDVSAKVNAYSRVFIQNIFCYLVRRKTSKDTIIVESPFTRGRTNKKLH